jgi:hypothetical protein
VQEFRSGHSQKPRQTFEVALIHLRASHAAAVPTGLAVDFVFHFLGNGLQPALYKITALKPSSKSKVVLALLFPDPFNLHEVRKHMLIIAIKQDASRMLRTRIAIIEGVTDQLSLSIWLPKSLGNWRTRYFEKLLSLIPFSQREQPQSTLSIQGVSVTEPPLLERAITGPVDLSEVSEALKDYQGDDVAYRLESWWDLWQYSGEDWQITPTRIAICAFGPAFDNGGSLEIPQQEDLRIDFGVDTAFLPDPALKGSGRLIESNIKSLLHLVHQAEEALPVEKRVLETESGENFAEKLTQTLGGQTLTH